MYRLRPNVCDDIIVAYDENVCCFLVFLTTSSSLVGVQRKLKCAARGKKLAFSSLRQNMCLYYNYNFLFFVWYFSFQPKPDEIDESMSV